MPGLTARDIMTPNPVTASLDMPVTKAARVMVDERIGAMPVVDGDKLVGIVTEGDLILQDVKLEYPTYIHLLDGFVTYPPSTARLAHELKKAVEATVRDVMTLHPITVQADTSVEDVTATLVGRDVSHVPVLDGDVLVGMVTKSDVLRSITGGSKQ